MLNFNDYINISTKMDNIINTLMELFFAWSRNKLVCAYIHVQLCLTLCDPMDCSPPGPSVYAVLQVRLMKWVAVSYSRESSQPRDQTHVSWIGRWVFFTSESPVAEPWVGWIPYIFWILIPYGIYGLQIFFPVPYFAFSLGCFLCWTIFLFLLNKNVEWEF